MVAPQVNVSAFGLPTMHGPLDVTLAPVLIVKEMVTEGVNPDPAMVTWVPLGPWFGVRAIVGVGAVTPNEAWAESKLPSEPVAVTV